MMKSKNSKFVFLLLFCVIFLCIGLAIKVLQNDTYYMIKLGDYIVHNGIDLKDHWVWAMNLSYTYPHWLYDVFIYYIYNYFGFLGIYVSNIIFYIVLILIIFKVNLKINNSKFLAFFLSIVTIILLSVAITARSQVISYILFFLEIFYILKLIDEGKKRYVLYLFIISFLIANIHATVWLFYFILYLPFIFGQLFYKLKCKYKITISKKLIINKIGNFKLLIVSFILSFFAGMFSPSRICYTYIFRIMLGNSQNYIAEHSPLVVINNPLFIGFILILLIVLIFTKVKINLFELFMISGLIFMSLISTRHVMLFYLIGGLFISMIVMRYFNVYKDYSLDIIYKIIITNNYIYILIMLIVLVSSFYNFNDNFKENYVDKKEYPIGAVKYIKENLDYKNMKLFNGYNYGSYLMFNDIPIIIDSRCDLYLNEFNKGVNIFNDIVISNGNYAKIFEKYGVEYALIKNDSYLYQLLIRDYDDILYNDKYFTLFKIE